MLFPMIILKKEKETSAIFNWLIYSILFKVMYAMNYISLIKER